MTSGDHVTVNGTEYELLCRAKFARYKGWMAHPCNADGEPDIRHEKWIADTEITGKLDKRTRQYEVPIWDTICE